MGAKLGPRIVADNLVLALDCADAKSYPGEPTVNILTDPNDFGGSDWNLKSGTFTNNSTTGPRGTLTACKVVATSTDPYCYSNSVHTIAAGSITLSFWVKGEGNTIGKTGDCRFNFTGTATGSNVTTDWGVNLTNEWQKVSVTATATGAGTIKFGIECPNGAVSGDVMYLADPQLEQKSYFTPFTEQNRADITSLLIHSNVGSGTSFEDSSPNKFTVTNTGLSGNLVTRSSSVAKFGSESLNFGSANTQYLEISDNDVFHFNTSDFTIEAWIYPLNFGNYRSIYHQGETSGNYYMNSVEVMSSGALRWLIRSQSTTILSITTNASTLTANTWQHIAATREGNYFKLWINGVLSKTSGFISTALDNLTYDVHIGNRVIGGTPTHQYYGYMDEVRVTNGTALYTAAFSPPTERFKNGAWLDISGNENNGNFINGVNTGTSHYRVGDVIYPAGTNSARYLEFDGSDQYLDLPIINYSTYSGLSVESWFNADALTAHTLMSSWGYVSNSDYCWLLFAGWWDDNKFDFLVSGNGANYSSVQSSTTLSTGTWYHIVGTWDNSGSMKIYINGSLDNSITGATTTLVNTNFKTGIGADFDTSSGATRFWNGKIGLAKIYDKSLTAAEILQNYNSTKSRFS